MRRWTIQVCECGEMLADHPREMVKHADPSQDFSVPVCPSDEQDYRPVLVEVVSLPSVRQAVSELPTYLAWTEVKPGGRLSGGGGKPAFSRADVLALLRGDDENVTAR